MTFFMTYRRSDRIIGYSRYCALVTWRPSGFPSVGHSPHTRALPQQQQQHHRSLPAAPSPPPLSIRGWAQQPRTGSSTSSPGVSSMEPSPEVDPHVFSSRFCRDRMRLLVLATLFGAFFDAGRFKLMFRACLNPNINISIYTIFLYIKIHIFLFQFCLKVMKKRIAWVKSYLT